MLIETSGMVVAGACDIQGKGCEAKKTVGPLTVVWGPNRNQINVCGSCLEMKIKSGEWEVEGAAVPSMKYRADLELINGKNVAIIEVKARPSNQYDVISFISKNIKLLDSVVFFVFVAQDLIYLFDKNAIDNLDMDAALKIKTDDVLTPYFSMLSYTNSDKKDGATRHSIYESALALLFRDITLCAKSVELSYFPAQFIDFVKGAQIIR
ncbi:MULTISPECIES: hypothetical protein [unclassified Desulfovibrio]|uniref:hypothetical protein n=1 Tax=unclassified Desulfovibrio TaxID=2593640 RepID=UPI000F5FB187|nr:MULTISPECIES: hypothetical protein [unclassified Desulfovibrio]RRD71949.1 hypothetical protein EII24_01850 [Desulfovibrio sp. OH1209_COT-279]RRD88162.1 hypothetical protein EII23_01850 [Desulfovibrio sp. OH1186_COT-070]